jgi:hypothetical protein
VNPSTTACEEEPDREKGFLRTQRAETLTRQNRD